MPRDEKKIGDVIQFVLNQRKLKGPYLTNRIEQIWTETMSPIVVDHTKKITVYNNVVRIYVDSAPLRTELLHGKEQIKAILNEKLSGGIVADVQIY